MAKFPIHGVSCENIKVFDIPKTTHLKKNTVDLDADRGMVVFAPFCLDRSSLIPAAFIRSPMVLT